MKQNDLKQPFFAALLESQRRTPAPDGQLWPWPTTSPLKDHHDQTHKYPSDNDEEGDDI
jgi:hypothetical protein